jgi:hypothetical protein
MMKWKAARIIYPGTSHRSINIFLKLMPNGEIRLLVDLVPHNQIMVEDHGDISNIGPLLEMLAGAKYYSTIVLQDQ